MSKAETSITETLSLNTYDVLLLYCQYLHSAATFPFLNWKTMKPSSVPVTFIWGETSEYILIRIVCCIANNTIYIYIYIYIVDCCNQNTRNLASCCSLLTNQKLFPLSGSSVHLSKLRYLLLCQWEIRNFTLQISLSEFHAWYLFSLTKELRSMTTDFL